MLSSTGERSTAFKRTWLSFSLYRDQIRENVLVKQYYCDVDIAHLISYDEELAHRLSTQPADIIPLVGTVSVSE